MVTLALLLVLANIYYTAGQCEQCLCPDTWIHYRGSCYKFADNMKVNWTEAAHYCGLHDGNLAVIDNAEEDAFLQDYSRRLFKNVPDREFGDSFWIGANDIDEEGTWTWYSDDSPLEYINWDDGQPNDQVEEQDCVFLYAVSDYAWHDVGCQKDAYPLCEMNLCSGEDIIVG